MRSYADIVGDGGSDVIQQVVEQRARIARRLGQVRRLLAVGSGKGGVGKSTLTWQLAEVLAAGGDRVAVLDADVNGPTQARLAGLQDVPLVPGPDGLALPRSASGIGVVSLGSLIPESHDVDFDSVAEGDSWVWRATREFSLLTELVGAVNWGALDALLVDLPPGAERTFQYAEFLGPQAAFVLVTQPSELARGVVARSAAALTRTPNRVVGYLVNMSGYHCERCEAVRPLFPEARAEAGALDLPCLGRIPFDPRLAAASDAGRGRGIAVGPTADALRAAADEIVRRLENSR